jgi:hypothetical protein
MPSTLGVTWLQVKIKGGKSRAAIGYLVERDLEAALAAAIP